MADIEGGRIIRIEYLRAARNAGLRMQEGKPELGRAAYLGIYLLPELDRDSGGRSLRSGVIGAAERYYEQLGRAKRIRNRRVRRVEIEAAAQELYREALKYAGDEDWEDLGAEAEKDLRRVLGRRKADEITGNLERNLMGIS